MADEPAGESPLILASASPRRRVLLAMLGLEAEVVAPNVDEEEIARGEDPVAAVIAVATAKARAVGPRDRPVLAADTLVLCEGEPLGKPADAADAERMLRLQMGRGIEVVSGVAVLTRSDELSTRHATSRVEVATLADDELDRYLASGEGADKAGALAIQGAAKHFTRIVAGSRSNVYGLPLAETIELLKAAGVGVRRTPSVG